MMSLETDFLNAIDTDGIISGKTPMGTLAKYYNSGDNGFNNREIISQLAEYNVSRESDNLLQISAKKIKSCIPDNSHIYLLGTSNKEVLLFTMAINKFASISCVDIVERVADEQIKVLRGIFKDAAIDKAVLDYQVDALPKNDAQNRLILYPSSNIGNTIGYHNQHVTENQTIIDQLLLLKQRANMLLLIYDTNTNAVTTTKSYSGPLHAKFVLDSFEFVANNLEIKGLQKANLIHSPQWNANCSAVLHQIVVAKTHNIVFQDKLIQLNQGQTLYPGHSYKFSENKKTNDINLLAKKAGWEPEGKPLSHNHSTVKMQLYIS